MTNSSESMETRNLCSSSTISKNMSNGNNGSQTADENIMDKSTAKKIVSAIPKER